MKTIIHINQHNIKHNRKPENTDKKAVITVKTYKTTTYANFVSIVDEDGKEIAKVVYSPDKPLSCGAHVWIEADASNVVVHEESGKRGVNHYE